MKHLIFLTTLLIFLTCCSRKIQCPNVNYYNTMKYNKYKTKFYKKKNFKRKIVLLPKRNILYQQYNDKIEPLIFDIDIIFS